MPLDVEAFITKLTGSWKLKSIEAWVAKNLKSSTPLIWIDDEMNDDDLEWAKDRGRTLFLKTDQMHGWDEEGYLQITKFLDEL